MCSVICSNGECQHVITVNLDDLDRESDGFSGTHTTWYRYEGYVACSQCKHVTGVCFVADVDDETDEILSVELE
ncbi:hypothetical protein TUM4438_46360 [Shewanella sairae]|uniref:Uncharacterized protein n=1 Tax=Shewanella sairae TaxID=190310 RepID=A0ABQ4PS14_9GAMM|nr:hypothetical protein [Shewanella sairae]MCL1132616.1 hypothetical protein [Shewanella sairae]GIU52837.1 hypothetical protein TUM4438_46360 [Shewanella sairae]